MEKHNHKHHNHAEGGCGEEGCSCCDLTPKYDLEEKKGIDKELVKEIVFLCVSLAFLIVGYFDWKHISGGNWPLLFLYYVNPAWVAIILCGIPIYINAVKTLSKKKINASVLISIAMTASIVLEIVGLCGVELNSSSHNHSYVFAAGEISFLMGLGELLEDLTVKKCRSGIQRLVSLIPKEAYVKDEDGNLKLTKLADINIGDIVVVKQGELIAVDGVIVKGEGSVDESSLTGEYLPKDVSTGDNVFGGSMNLDGVLEVEVQKLQKDMTIAKMAELTMEAEGKKAPISKVADKWASIIVPFVLLTSFIVGIIAAFGLKVGTVQAIVRAVTILVVFCPCSLVLATPTAIAAGLGNAAKNGVLIKSGTALESLSKVDTVCFDKTGTITEGKIVLDTVIALDGNEEEFIKIVGSLEKYSEHPLAKAVVERCSDFYDVENINPLKGVGIIGEISGSEVLVISLKRAKENGLDLKEIENDIEDALSKGKTIVVALQDGSLLGMMAFTDTIKANSKEVMTSLKDMGLNSVMLTGDNEQSAQNVASICDIQTVYHSLLPQDKLAKIEEIEKEGHKVVMVGDGVNDAPALKLATCSFAMGAMGSDIAIDTADMAILNSDLEKVKDTIKLSRRVLRAIKRNITIAMSINVVAIILSLFGFLNPATGALVHNCTSVLVVASSALLLYNRKKK